MLLAISMAGANVAIWRAKGIDEARFTRERLEMRFVCNEEKAILREEARISARLDERVKVNRESIDSLAETVSQVEIGELRQQIEELRKRLLALSD